VPPQKIQLEGCRRHAHGEELIQQSAIRNGFEAFMMTTVRRVFNFSAGPAVLPVPVLEEIQRDLLALPGVGMSILEISHRSKAFEGILAEAEANIRKLAGIPGTYKVLFLQGGASLQFSMVPMNLLGQGQTADYIDCGSWADKAIKEAKKVGTVNVAASTKGENYSRLPRQSELKLTPGAAYVHMTSNNTIEGTEYNTLPGVGDVPLVSDASSDIFSAPIDVSKFGAVYAGAQKNLGPAGVTLVIIREDLVARSAGNKSLPTMLKYSVHAENTSLYNTPPSFAVYAIGLVVKWLIDQGGLPAMGVTNRRKAAKLYAEIDRTGFYRGTADKADRSRMNVTFRLSSEDLEKQFVKEATAAGLDGLKGHRSVGGMRASIYNAFPETGIDALVSFMQEFEKKNG
jgi:phosphoserine aminotransferase